MSIYLWITLIGAITLFFVMILLFRKFLSGKDNILLITAVITAGIVISVFLFIMTSVSGTLILSSDFVTEYQIKEQTYKTTEAETDSYQNAAYAFYAENGVKYQLHGTELLKAPAASPSYIGIYTCEAVEGTSWCYLKKGKVIRYTLTELSHDGKQAIDYETNVSE